MSARNINITVLTESLLANYSQLSIDSNLPTQIPNSYLNVIISSSNYLENADDGSLLTLGVIQEKVAQGNINTENIVRFNVRSESGNYDNPVILYNIKKTVGKSIFKLPFDFESYLNIKTVAPKSFNPFVSEYVNQDFWFCQSPINRYGTAVYVLQCAVYTDDLTLYGYFQFSHKITIREL
jgi:hypothetical protein